MSRNGTLRTWLALSLGFSAVLLLLSGHLAAAAAAVPSAQLEGTGVPQLSTPAQGSIDPNSGSTRGGTEVTISVENPPALVASAHGNGFGVAVTDAGQLVSWGNIWSGNNADFAPTLVDAAAIASQGIKQLAAADKAYLLTEPGNLYRWNPGAPEPEQVSTVAFDGKVVQIAPSGDQLIVLTETGTVFVVDGNSEVEELQFETAIAEIAASQASIVVRSADGGVWTSTAETFLTGGLTRVQDDDSPESELAAYSFVQLAAGDGWFGAVDDAGSVFTWEHGGNPELVSGDLPIVTQLVISGNTAVVLAEDGQIYNWERGDAPAPVDLQALEGAKAERISSGSQSFFLHAGGSLYAWGEGTGGQLGTGSSDDVNSPTLSVNFWPTEVQFGEVAASGVSAQSRTTLVAITPEQNTDATDVSV